MTECLIAALAFLVSLEGMLIGWVLKRHIDLRRRVEKLESFGEWRIHHYVEHNAGTDTDRRM